MNTFCRISRIIVLPMAFILPFWLTFGRGALGVGGWLSLLYVFMIAPAVFIILLAFYFLLSSRNDVIMARKLGTADSTLLAALYISVFLQGFFAVDGGDTAESINSVAMKVFGRGFENTSSQLGGVFFTLSLALIMISLVMFLYERLRGPL